MNLDWTIGTVFPAICLAAAGALVPMALYQLHGPSLRALAVNLLASALILVFSGGLLFVLLYAGAGADLTRSPVAAGLHFLGLGLSAALFWLPILILTGLALGQRSEARLSKDREAREAAE
jgi:hypothetical protein